MGRSLDNVQVPGALNVAGTAGANILNATTQYNIAGNRVFTVTGTPSFPNSNTFAGIGAGALNTPSNSGFEGNVNSFFGESAGAANTTGHSNAFFGSSAGTANTTGTDNAFFGRVAGFKNTTGGGNNFFGTLAGQNNTTGNGNSFLGFAAGFSNIDGMNNTAIGSNTDVGTGLSHATAIGYGAKVTQSNSLILGGISDAGFTDTNVGIGTTAPRQRLHIRENNGDLFVGNSNCGPGKMGIAFATSVTNCTYALLGGDNNTYINRFFGGTIIFREANGPNQVEIRPGGTVGIATLDTGGSVQLCRNSIAAISTCSSSLRYKRDVQPFSRGLELIDQLRPITFTWKQDGKRDVGLGAEDVAVVEPLLTFRNAQGEIEGVKYSQLSAVLINAVKELKAENERLRQEQQAQIKAQQQQIAALRRLVCHGNPRAQGCRRKDRVR